MAEDSRILHVSSGAAGIIRKTLTQKGTLERAFCISCGRPGGWVSSEQLDSAIYVCSVCDRVNGPLPLPRLKP